MRGGGGRWPGGCERTAASGRGDGEQKSRAARCDGGRAGGGEVAAVLGREEDAHGRKGTPGRSTTGKRKVRDGEKNEKGKG